MPPAVSGRATISNTSSLIPARIWIIAVASAIACSAISVNFSFFRAIPYSLAFLAISIFATLYGTRVSVSVAVISIASRAVFRTVAFPHDRPLTYFDLLASGVLLTAALTVSLLTRSRRRTASELEVAHAELNERTDALLLSLHNGKCASWVLDLESGKGAQWYSGSYQVFGRPFAEIEALPSLVSLLHPEDQPRLGPLVVQMKSTLEPILWEFRVPWPNGELHWLEMRATRVPGSRCVWRGLTFDITERKLSELALLRSEKLAAMGRLASTVAHEINNPLEAVTNLLYLARNTPDVPPEAGTYLATAETELARLGEITRLTLGFVRTNSAARPLLVAQIADDVLAIFRHRLESRGVQIDRTYDPGVTIRIAPHELRQIFTNLISNATDAISDLNPRIAVRIQSTGGRAAVMVEDNGSGIDAAHLQRIFEPFFTTKHDIGTGIGLWVTRELIESNGGYISVESGALPNGFQTRFTIEFPAVVQ